MSEQPSESSVRFRLWDMVKHKISLWRTPSNEPYADLTLSGEIVSWQLDRPQIEGWLRQQYLYMTNGKDIATEAILKPVLDQLKSDALTGPLYTPSLRVNRQEEVVQVDLMGGKIVEISPQGWKLGRRNGVKFVNGDGMLKQQEPMECSPPEALSLLRKYLHVSCEEDFKLIVSWLVGAYIGNDGYPILILNGGAGTSKSSTTSLLRRLVDPHSNERREPPKETRDVAAIARNSYVVALDNLQSLPVWLSDALCRLSTGGTVGGRALYTNSTDAGFNVLRPIILNGIPQFVDKGDLMDRSLLITLPFIPPSERRSWADIERDFDVDRPKILGGLFAAISQSLREGEVGVALPRLAGWGRGMINSEESLGWEKGSFMSIFSTNAQSKSDELIGGDPVAQAIIGCLQDKQKKREAPVIRGTMTQIMNTILIFAPGGKMEDKPQRLAYHLRKIQQDLATQGIHIHTSNRTKNGTEYEIRLA